MKVDRMTRVNNLLHRELGEQLYRVLGPTDIDLAAVTITRVETSPDLRNAWVYVSVLGDETVQRGTMKALRRARREFQQAVNRDVHMKYTPKLEFRLDSSLAAGDAVLDILSDLDTKDSEGESPDDTSANE